MQGARRLSAMPISQMLCLNDVRPEARKSVESWALKADQQYKKRYYKYFSDGPEGASPLVRGTSRGSGTKGSQQFDRMPSLDTFEAAEKELELKNWATCYQTTNNSLGPALAAVKKRAQGDVGRVLEPLVKEVLKPKARNTVAEMQANFTESELAEFVKLMRSLSIAYEQDRTAYRQVACWSRATKHAADGLLCDHALIFCWAWQFGVFHPVRAQEGDIGARSAAGLPFLVPERPSHVCTPQDPQAAGTAGTAADNATDGETRAAPRGAKGSSCVGGRREWHHNDLSYLPCKALRDLPAPDTRAPRRFAFVWTHGARSPR